MGIAMYNEECDNCHKKTPGTFMPVLRHSSSSEGIKTQFWCFECLHGKNFIPEIKKSVCFIFLKKNGKFIPNGTGFLVSIETKKDSSSYIMYLVTARHVLQDERGDYFDQIYLRLNKKDGAEFLPIDLNRIEIFVHDDGETDIGVISLSLNRKYFEYGLLPEYIIPDLAKTKELEISEGDDVFFAGLFESHYGQERNQPIIRFGKVALMTDEKVEWYEEGVKTPMLLDLYLMECQSYSGNSGSPLFFNLLRQQGKKLDEQGPNVYLAGVVKGGLYKTASNQNTGIAAVTPSYKLYEILYSDKVNEVRESATDYII